MSNSITTTIGDDIEVTVNFDYTPAQRAILDRAPEDCQPGFDAEVDITEVLLNGVDILSVLSDDVIEELEERILAPVEQDFFVFDDEDLEYWEF